MIDTERIKQLLEKNELTKEERNFLEEQEKEIHEEATKLLDNFPRLITWNFLINIDFSEGFHFLKIAVRDKKRCIETVLDIGDVKELKKALEEFEKYHKLTTLENICHRRRSIYP